LTGSGRCAPFDPNGREDIGFPMSKAASHFVRHGHFGNPQALCASSKNTEHARKKHLASPLHEGEFSIKNVKIIF